MIDQEAKDRLEIQELLARYSWAMADKDWDAWQSVFAPGATVDYSTAGGPVGTPAEAAAALSAMMQAFDVAMSQGTNLVITFESTEQASCRSMYRMLMRPPSANRPTLPPTWRPRASTRTRWYAPRRVGGSPAGTRRSPTFAPDAHTYRPIAAAAAPA